MKKGSIYIHVPFCKTRCAYCSFFSSTNGMETKREYTDAVCLEAKERAIVDADGMEISSVYFGGGTPTQLPIENLERMMHALQANYRISEDAEVTFEANPDDITPTLIHQLRDLGANRISMGVQSFSDEVLSKISRRHTSRQAVKAVETTLQHGISNVSIDLIYGLPGQEHRQWQQDLNMAFSLGISHLSSYALSIEEGTALFQQKKRGDIREASEDDFLLMYGLLQDTAEHAGFQQYEISNFALPGFHSRHNSGYWNGQPYIGLGPAAHSYDGLRTRRWNAADLYAYTRFWKSREGNVKSPTPPPFDVEVLNDDELYDERVMTRLRTAQGMDLRELPDFRRDYLLHMSQPYVKKRLLEIIDGHLRFTRNGIFLSDTIMADLMWDSEAPSSCT